MKSAVIINQYMITEDQLLLTEQKLSLKIIIQPAT